MILPAVKEAHPRSLLKRKQPPLEVVDIVSDVCSYETISDYIQLFGEEQSLSPDPGASLSPGPSLPQDDEDSNLSWLLNFKVSSLFDPTEERPKEDTCVCAGAGHQRSLVGKPPFTYTELIEKALREQGELTVSGIYTWISTKYPYYSPTDDRWKNSVRHNLSINPHFRKGVKSRHGAGHLWTLSNEGVDPPPESWKRCRLSLADEAAVAAASIMPDPEPLDQGAQDPALTRAAEEILSGVKRRVEVQYLVHDHNTNGAESWLTLPDHTIFLSIPPHPHSEFLNPVSKEELVSESGLDTSACEASSSLLSELHSELHLPDNLFSDDLAFSCYSHL